MIKFIFENLGRFRRRFWLVFLAGSLDGVAVFMIPVIFSKLAAQQPGTNYWLYFEIAVACYVCSLGLQWVIRKYGESLGFQLANQTRYNLFLQLKEMSIASLNKTHSGYLLSLVNKLSDGMQNICFDVSWTTSKIFSNLGLFFFFTYLESPPIALMNLVILSLFVIISAFLSRRMAVLAKEMNVKRASLMETYADMMANIATIKKLSIFDFAEEKIQTRTLDNYKQIDKNQSFHANRWFVLHSLFGLAFMSTMGYLLYLVLIGQVSVGVLVLFIAAFQLVKGNVERLSESYKLFVENRSYLENLQEVLLQDEPKRAGTVKQWKKIVFSEVSFQHGGNSKKISIPNFEIAKGKKVAIIGKSGQGKSTFLNLLVNFILPDSGKRMLDAMDFGKVPTSFWQKNIALVNQEVELFNLSLRENLILNSKISDEMLWKYLEEVDLADWCRELKNGLDTMIGEKGLRLSAGQKQRINLLRGVLLNREIMILDEPTSHLDAVTEKIVIAFLAKYLKDRTVVIVSHKPGILKICDQVYKIEKHKLLPIS